MRFIYVVYTNALRFIWLFFFLSSSLLLSLLLTFLFFSSTCAHVYTCVSFSFFSCVLFFLYPFPFSILYPVYSLLRHRAHRKIHAKEITKGDTMIDRSIDRYRTISSTNNKLHKRWQLRKTDNVYYYYIFSFMEVYTHYFCLLFL